MEHPYPVHIDRAWIAALETSVLATEEEPAVLRLEDCRDIQFQLFGFKTKSAPMPTWPISSLSTPPIQKSIGGDKDLAEELRSLSETAGWYDDALFSPAASVPRTNTSNIDWYGGSLKRDDEVSPQSCCYHGLLPQRASETLATTTPTFGITIPEQTTSPQMMLLTDSLPTPTIYRDESDWGYAPLTEWNDNTKGSSPCPNITMQQPFELLAALAPLNTSGAPPFTVYTSSTALQLPYSPTCDASTPQQCNLCSNELETVDMAGHLWWELGDGVTQENPIRLIIPDNYCPEELNQTPTVP